MNIKIFFYALLGIFFTTGCLNTDRFEYSELENKLANIKEGASFKLDTLSEKDWDQFYIIKPYETFKPDSLGICVPKEIINILESTRLFDSYCLLLFFKDKEVISYSKVSRNICDFSYSEKNDYSSNQEFLLDSLRIPREVFNGFN